MIRVFDDGDDGAAAIVVVPETFLIAQESSDADIILLENGDSLALESSP
jgi:hypothetical protein